MKRSTLLSGVFLLALIPAILFSPEGIFVRKVLIDQKIAVFKHGRVYSLLRPEEGYPSIKRYKMEFVPAGI